MRFLHGTNSLALKQILKEGFIKPLGKTNQQNLCRCTTTMQDDVVYLTTEKMIAGFYTPRHKENLDGEDVYSCILEIELPYKKKMFRPDEDYMNDILSLSDYNLYNKYLKPQDYEKYAEPITKFVKNGITKEDLDFRYLLYLDKELGIKILSEADPMISLQMGCIAYVGEIPLTCVKAITVADIFERKTTDVSLEGLNKAIAKVDMTLSLDNIHLPFAI